MATVFGNPKSLREYEILAQKKLPAFFFNYYNYPGAAGQTYTDSVDAFKRYRFRPQIMTDVSTRRLSTTLLGQPVSLPIGVAPTACHCFAHKDGEIATARGAAAVGAPMIQSTLSNKPMPDIVEAAPEGLRWQQVYIWKDRRVTEHVVRKAEENGYRAIVLTVDSPKSGVVGTGNFGDHPMFFNQPQFGYPTMDIGLKEQEEYKRKGDVILDVYFWDQFNPTLTWKDVSWLKTITSLPVVCKGILTGKAAQSAVDAGADAIIVSAHGGRQLDGVISSIDALAEVVDAVRNRNVEVYMDGGIRSGRDVLKALALGAKAVFVGRPVLWGLACTGAAGVEHVLTILRDELDSAMALCGCSDVNSVPSDVVIHQSRCFPTQQMSSKL